MRIVFTVIGTPSHLYPMVPLAWACRAAGHEVRLASTPAFLASYGVHTGLPAVQVGGGPRNRVHDTGRIAELIFSQPAWPADWAADPRRLDPRRQAYLEALGRYLIVVADKMVDDVVAFARRWRPELIVYDGVSYAGAVAGAVLGVPTARHLYGTTSVPRLELRPATGEPLPEYVRLFGRFGVTVREASATVDPTPPSLRCAVDSDRLDERHVPYNGAGAVPAGLAGPRRRPRVCVTWGHSSSESLGGAAADPFRAAIGAVARAGAEAVVLTTADQVELFGAPPAGARVLADVPVQLVLPSCDAIVHQGGDGTTLAAAALGVPQLAITRKPDHDLTGARLAATGAGLHLLARGAVARPVLRDAIDALLTDPAYRDAAGRLRAENDERPSPAEVVPALTGLGGVDPAGRR